MREEFTYELHLLLIVHTSFIGNLQLTLRIEEFTEIDYKSDFLGE